MRTFAQKQKPTQKAKSACSTRLSRTFAGQSPEVSSILHLQRTIGNQAVQRLLQANGEERKDSLLTSTSLRFAQTFSRIPVHINTYTNMQPKLKVNAPGDMYEREADRVVEQVMRMPEPQQQHTCAGGGGCPKCQSKQLGQKREFLQPSRAEAYSAGEIAAPPNVHDVLRSPGQPLGSATQAFFEPRFGHDFSHVRVHTDAQSADTAKRIKARAFTVGRDVVFGAGEYMPNTDEGKRLLAHELTHVVQQGSGLVSRCVQRASINYRQLTWTDFKGSIPAASSVGAETVSGFNMPGWKAKKKITNTKKACKVKKKKSTIHSAKIWIDPAVFDKIEAIMKSGKSWALSKYKDPDKHCDGVVKRCKTEIGKQAAKAKKTCKTYVKPCKKGFKKGWDYYKVTVDGTTVKVTSKSDCSTKLVSGCEKAHAKKQLFEIKDHKVPVSKAVSKSDCTDPKFKKDCIKHYKVWGPLILKHEQGHFDISNAIAGKAKADLKKEAAKYVATATGCGKVRANNEADKKFKALNAPSKLPKRGQKWIDLKNQAEKDYDNDTEHGLKKKEQATWEKNIADGLKAYDLSKP